jgi:hypothetical protein
MHVALSDPVQLNGATLAASYSPDATLPTDERIHLRASYRRYDWTASASLNEANFYDLFGPTKTSRRGYSFGLGHKTVLIFDEPRQMNLQVSGRVAGHLDQLPESQNVFVNVDRLISVAASLSYVDAHSSLGSVDDEKGQRWSAVAQIDEANAAAYTRVYGTYDRGFALPVSHSSIWIRSAAGVSPQNRDEPFANFFFGAFGNNYVDRGDEKRYREYYAFPGAPLDGISGRNFGKSTIEWNLPPLRFRQGGTPGFYVTWMRPALFAGGLATNLDASDVRRVAGDYGGQLDFRMTVLSNLDLTLSAGAAALIQRDGPPRRELMISLKVLR